MLIIKIVKQLIKIKHKNTFLFKNCEDFRIDISCSTNGKLSDNCSTRHIL